MKTAWGDARTFFLLLLLLCSAPFLLVGAEGQRRPRLVGIVALPGTKLALLQTPAAPPKSLIMSEHQSDLGIEVLRIDPETETVQLRLGFERDVQARVWDIKSERSAAEQSGAVKAEPRVAAATFSEDGTQIITVVTNTPVTIGFHSQTNNVEPANPGMIFENARLKEILGVYEELSERTLLRDSVLPAGNFNLRIRAETKAEAVRALEAALAEQQISCIPDGDKFMMILRQATVGKVRPGSSEIKAEEKADVLPAGVINFQSIDALYVAQIYAELMGRKLEMPDPRRGFPQITFKTRTPLSKTEAIYGLQKVFELNGCKLVATEGDKVKLVPLGE